MAKANKAVFAQLTQKKDVSYPLGNGDTLDITLNTLKLRDIAEIEGMSETDAKYEIILRSVIGELPDIDMDDIMNIPMFIVEDLINDICEFNGIDKVEVSTDDGI
jgi:hypothetical protein